MVGAGQIGSLRDTLAETGGTKVWSLVVTLLGDLAQDGAEREVPGPVLTDVLDRLGIQGPALRTALHRLRRDGWLDTRKEGRTSFVRLSQRGLAETWTAAPRVFGPGAVSPDGWTLAVGESPLTEPSAGLALKPGVMLLPGRVATLPDGWLCADAGALMLPDWARARAMDAAREPEFRRLLAALTKLSPEREQDPVSRAALRLLVLHGWRRLVLRTHPVAEQALGPASAVSKTRTRVHSLLDALPRSAQPERLKAGPKPR